MNVTGNAALVASCVVKILTLLLSFQKEKKSQVTIRGEKRVKL